MGWLSHALDYHKRKLSFFLSTSYSNGLYMGDEVGSIRYPDLLWVDKEVVNYYENGLRIRAGLGWDVGKNWTRNIRAATTIQPVLQTEQIPY